MSQTHCKKTVRHRKMKEKLNPYAYGESGEIILVVVSTQHVPKTEGHGFGDLQKNQFLSPIFRKTR